MFPQLAPYGAASAAPAAPLRPLSSDHSRSHSPPPFSHKTRIGQTVALPTISVTTSPPSKPTNQAAGDATVVSPTTVPTPSDQSASSVTVITGTDIETQQLRTVPDALATVPGLNVVQSGGPGGQTSVFLRGTNSNHVKVFSTASTCRTRAIPMGHSISASC